MNEKKNNGILSIVGLIALLIACVIGVQAMFTALGAMGAEGKAAATYFTSPWGFSMPRMSICSAIQPSFFPW